jgi:hypothetical protein
MLLDDCDLNDIAAVLMAPFERNQPEEEWVSAAKEGTIPSSLYDLYQRANFLSFGTAPRFLSDPEKLLFSYFGLVLRSIQQSLVDAQEQADLFVSAHELVYDPFKRRSGERWEKDADKRQRRHFRDMLIALQTALDAMADIIAIFLPGGIKGLAVGRAQFSKIEEWLKRPLPVGELILPPPEFFLKELYDALKPLVQAPHPEKDWLPLMRLLRNKAAHLGQPLFRLVALPQANDGHFYTFIPRQWPYLWERHFKLAGQQPGGTPSVPQLMRDELIHQDIVTYSRGLVAKINSVVAAATAVLNKMYEQFRDSPGNQAALLELESSSVTYKF